MPDSIISVENLSKCYLLGHQGEREKYTALRDVIARNVRGLARTTRDMLTGRQVVSGDEVEEFWALKDVSFEVKKGEVLGIIGRNGAGKSTLLKILSRITEPTKGRIEIKGRVASLLEVGTGFHPELTGRENIFLNGAILGMTRAEIRKSFDEIVAFAEVEKFLDTPVKRFSSGMYVRLAFAVAAHLDPEILIVDEVLAVGDAQFQKKCMGKMQDVASGGRTVLFVSHQLPSLKKFCTKAILLDQGKVEKIGEVDDVINDYIEGNQMMLTHQLGEIKRRAGGNLLRIVGFEVCNQINNKTETLLSGEPFSFKIYYYSANSDMIKDASVGFSIHSSSGETVAIMFSEYTDNLFSDLNEYGFFECKISGFDLAPGRYSVALRIMGPKEDYDFPNGEIATFEVEGSYYYNKPVTLPHGLGLMMLKGEWSHK